MSRDPSQAALLVQPCFKAAMAQVLAELFSRQTLVVVTGEAGLGKTLLLREIERVLQAAEWRVADETHIESVLRRPIPAPTAMLIDGPGHISPTQMQHLLRLKNVAVVLALPNLPELPFPFYAPVRLKPLSVEASTQFVTVWLQQSGARPDVLTGKGLARVIQCSKGIPRHLASLLQELVKRTDSPVKPLSQLDVDEAAQRLKLTVTSVSLPEDSPAITLERLQTGANAEPNVAIALPLSKRDRAYAPTLVLERLLPTNPGSAALTGLLCGIGAAIVGLLLQDLLTASRDGTVENRAAQTTTTPTSHEMSSPASNLAGPSGTSPKTPGEHPKAETLP